MKAFARFSLVAILLLLGVLVGCWTYLTIRYGTVQEFLAGDDAPRFWRPAPGLEREPEVDYDNPAERAAGEVKHGRPAQPEEPEGRADWRQVKPPENKGYSASQATPEDVVEAALDDVYEAATVSLDGEVRRWNTKGSNDWTYARTRPENFSRRAGYFSRTELEAMAQGGLFKAVLAREQRGSGPFYLRGRVLDHQTRKPIRNAVVALTSAVPGSWLAQRAVSNELGDFALPIDADTHKGFIAKKSAVALSVFADGHELRTPGAVEPDSNGLYELHMQPSRGLRVRVRVENPTPADNEVRVWLEERNDLGGPLADDHIFMSALCPARGELLFRLPGPFAGKIRVGASGHGWASEAVYEAETVKGNLVDVQIRLVPAPTVRMEGRARYELKSGLVSPRNTSGSLSAARIESSDGRGLCYTDSEGNFSLYALFASSTERRPISIWHQCGVASSLDPEDMSGDDGQWASLVPAGRAPNGLWRFHFQVVPHMVAELPATDEHNWARLAMTLWLTDGATIESSWQREGALCLFEARAKKVTSFVLAERTDYADVASLMQAAVAEYRITKESLRALTEYVLDPSVPGSINLPLKVQLERRK